MPTPNSSRAAATLAIAATAVAAWPLVGSGLPRGHDLVFELVRVEQFGVAAAAGAWPRWAPDLFGGYGYPIFTFFPPIFQALAAGGASVFGVTGGVRLALALLWIVSCLAMWRLARRLGADAWIGGCCVALYALAPYRWHDVYVRSAFSEATALALAPVAAVGVLAAVRTGGAARIGAAAIGVALFVASHNLSAAMYAPVLAALVIAGPRSDLSRRVVRGATVAAWAAAIAAIYLVPLAAELPLVRVSAGVPARWAAPANLLEPRALWGPEWRATVVWMLAVSVAVAVFGRRLGPKRLGLGALGVVVVAATTTPLRPLWESCDADLLMFPWRLFSPASFVLCAALAAGLVGASGRAAAGGLALAALATAIFGGFPLPPRLEVPESALARDVVRASWATTTVADEYVALTVEERPRVVATTTVGVDDPAATLRIDLDDPFDRRFELELRQEATLLVRLMWYPGWMLEVDGVRVTPDVTRFGTATTQLAPGRHSVRVSFETTRAQRTGAQVSLVALVAALVAAATERLRARRSAARASGRR